MQRPGDARHWPKTAGRRNTARPRNQIAPIHSNQNRWTNWAGPRHQLAAPTRVLQLGDARQRKDPINC
eukprot:10276155-Lingulodinium_polyedra.AAC.1